VRRHAFLLVVIASLLIAACGGSGRAVSATSSASSPTVTSASHSGAATSASRSGAATSASRSGAATSASRSGAATSSSSSGAATSSTASASGSQSLSTGAAARARNSDIRLPVTFAIGAGGSLAPPEIAVPKNIDIDLTVTSKDGSAHTFELKTPHGYLATVRPGTPTRALLRGTPPGTYSVVVDNRVAGQLIIGVAPGP
jgi:hypothetical protein